MRSGQFLAAGIVLATAAFGAGVWYAQTRAYYTEIEPGSAAAEIRLMAPSGETEALQVTGFQGIDAESSPLRLRACFETEAPLDALADAYLPYDGATPLTAPGWFDCFDAEAIAAALAEGRARAFIGAVNEPYGFDRVVVVTKTGRGYAWPQLNDCGEAAFSGDPLPAVCPPAPVRS